MQRTQRAKAGNIYKKRLEEIQMEAPRPKSKAKSKKKPTKGGTKGNRVNTKRTSGTSKSSSNHGYLEGEDSDEFREPGSGLNEQSDVEYEFEDGDGCMEVGSRSNSNSSRSSSSRTTPASRASLRIQKSMMSKFKCPHCKATFAEERYVDFHCKEVHKSIIQEEKKMIKKTVSEARIHYKQLSQRVNKGYALGHPEMSPPRQTSDSDDGEEQSDQALDLPDPPEFDLNDVGIDEEDLNLEDYYETVECGDVDMYRCKRCPSFQVASKHVIATHVQRHISTIPNYRCPYCRFKAVNRASLEVHIYTHTGVKPFCCKVCDLTFKCMDDLLAHSKVGHNQSDSGAGTHDHPVEENSSQRSAPKSAGALKPPQNQHKCPYCTQGFMSPMNLETHINAHLLKGITDEEREEELRSREESSQGTVGGGGGSPSRCLPARPKRRYEMSGSSNVKKVKGGVDDMDDPYSQAKRSMLNEGPPRCKICSKVFLYTTSIEKHMREVHSIKPLEEAKPTRFSPERASTSADSTETSIIPLSPPPPLTPIITSVTSRAGAEEALTIEGGQLPVLTESASTSSNGIKKSPQSEAIALSNESVQMKGKIVDAKSNPMKSVYLLFDPNSNTVIPIAPSLLGFPDGKGKSESAASAAGLREVVLANQGSPSSSGIGQSEDGQPPDASQLADLLVDQEIAAELQRIGKPGTPLFEGADNQDLEHTCTLCQTKIVGYIEIVKHFHTHTFGENYVCHLCRKRFSSKASLGVHFLIHVGITFSCPLCHKKLAKKQSLLEHIRYHRGERRHTCKICGKAFITSSSLNRHVRMHDPAEVSAPSQFTCTYCHRGFQEQSSFAQHLRAHKVMSMHAPVLKPSDSDSNGPISCHYCGTFWASQIGLSRHLRSIHGTDLAELPPSLGTASVIVSSFQKNQNRMAVAPAATLPLRIQPGVVFTEAKPAAVKIIDVIDLSDDEEGNGGSGVSGGGANIVSEMEIPEIPGGNKVNLDGEEVDAIEVVTTEVIGESPMDTDKFLDSPIEVEVTTTVVAGEDNSSPSVAVGVAGDDNFTGHKGPVSEPQVKALEGSEESVTEQEQP